jgi:hypothetical protein
MTAQTATATNAQTRILIMFLSDACRFADSAHPAHRTIPGTLEVG